MRGHRRWYIRGRLRVGSGECLCVDVSQRMHVHSGQLLCMDIGQRVHVERQRQCSMLKQNQPGKQCSLHLRVSRHVHGERRSRRHV